MKPTIGRIVHYNHDGRIIAGLIAKVTEEKDKPTVVGLRLFDFDSDSPEWISCVEGTKKGQWSWPPQVVAGQVTSPIKT